MEEKPTALCRFLVVGLRDAYETVSFALDGRAYEWAQQNHVRLWHRGRIPNSVLARYEAED